MSATAAARQELETLRVIAAHAGLTDQANERVGDALKVIRAALDSKPTTAANGSGHRDKPAPEVLPLVLLWFATLNGIKHQHHLVKGLLLAGSLFVVYGESNSGKTFFVLDLALTTAAGRPWRGKRTRRGLVIYVAGEGAASVRARVTAWHTAQSDVATNLPFAIVPQVVDFLSGPSIDQLIATIKAAEAECGESAVLIIVDTFARAIPGGNENDAVDIGIAVSGADRIRVETGAAIGFVHHSGKDPTKGARGSSALRAATDTEIQVEGLSGTRTATVTKQRDLASGERMAFELTSVSLGTDHEGEAVTSCVVRHLDAPQSMPPMTSSARAGGRNQGRALSGLREWLRSHRELTHITTLDLHEVLKVQSLRDRRRRQECITWLVAQGMVTNAVGGYTLHPEVIA